MGATGIRERRRVRVWVDDESIVDRTVDAAYAKRLAAAMRRRFISLRVTDDPVLPRASEATSVQRGQRAEAQHANERRRKNGGGRGD